MFASIHRASRIPWRYQRNCWIYSSGLQGPRRARSPLTVKVRNKSRKMMKLLSQICSLGNVLILELNLRWETWQWLRSWKHYSHTPGKSNNNHKKNQILSLNPKIILSLKALTILSYSILNFFSFALSLTWCSVIFATSVEYTNSDNSNTFALISLLSFSTSFLSFLISLLSASYSIPPSFRDTSASICLIVAA